MYKYLLECLKSGLNHTMTRAGRKTLCRDCPSSSGASVHLQRRAGGIDMEAMWAAAKQAEAERVVRATALQKDQKDKGKAKGKVQIGKLKAMMDRADAEMREAARKLPRSERMPVQPPAAFAR